MRENQFVTILDMVCMRSSFFVIVFSLEMDRTENSIKNHWNCSLRRRLGQYSASNCALYNTKTEPRGEISGVPKDGLGPLDPKPDSERNDAGPCLDLALGNPRHRGTNSPKKGGQDREITKMPLSPSGSSPDTFLRIGNPSFGSESSSCSLRPTHGGSDKSGENELYRSFVDSNNYRGLCYEPLQEEDLNIRLLTGEFPSTDKYIRVPRSPVSNCTPVGQEQGIFVIPESILRTAAMSYKNTPSIIRKRRFQGLKKLNEGQILVSPPKAQRIEKSDALKSMEKRLEPAFDDVWDRSGNADISVSDARGSNSVSLDSGDSHGDGSNSSS